MKISRLLIGIVVIVALFLGYRACAKGSTTEENTTTTTTATNEEVKKLPPLPETMFINELTSLRDTPHGIPTLPVTIGVKVDVIEENQDQSWIKVSTLYRNKKYSGWIEKKFLGETQLKDKDIIITRRVWKKVEIKSAVEGKPSKYVKKKVPTKVSMKKYYNLGNVQFKSINKKSYEGNPKIASKAIYISLNGMVHIDKYIELAHKTNINTFVLDVKNNLGRTLFYSPTVENEMGKNYPKPRIRNFKALMKKLKDNHIYVIGRLSTFKDQGYVNRHKDQAILDKRHGRPYKSADNVAWLTAFNRRNWYYNVELAKEAADYGINEILFDFVRFPDRVQSLERHKYLDYRNTYHETKPEAIQRFLKYAHDELSKKKVYITASIFGQVGISDTDENIGQHWETISTIVDNINPMAYPSHFAPGTFGLRVPDANPYKLMKEYARRVNSRDAKLEDPANVETWIQAFTATWVRGHIRYKEAELKAQIKGLKDEGLDGYLVWNAASRYKWNGFK